MTKTSIHRILMVSAMLITPIWLSGCASILSATSGPEQIDEAPGSRTLGAYIEDESIETKVLANLYNANIGYKEGNISAVSYNGIVLLVGQLKSDELLEKATVIAQRVRSVRKVHNELTVAGPISYMASSNDSWLTTKIKSKMLTTSGFPSGQAKVVTENGVVYLMGLLTHKEAKDAVFITRQVYGVQKIVKIIEYID
ncbi:MAG: phospholipid-binding protein [Moraxellaceae bacterium]|nr:MAG: phospholipid-binding protein [Moraxellaceae bacterium]